MLQFPKTLARKKAGSYSELCANMREDITTLVQLAYAKGEWMCTVDVTPDPVYTAVTKTITTELVDLFGYGNVLHMQGLDLNGNEIPLWVCMPPHGLEHPHKGKVCIVLKRKE